MRKRSSRQQIAHRVRDLCSLMEELEEGAERVCVVRDRLVRRMFQEVRQKTRFFEERGARRSSHGCRGALPGGPRAEDRDDEVARDEREDDGDA